MDTENTHIDLTETDTKAYSEEKLIQKKALEEFKSTIERIEANLDKSCDNKFERFHNTILINGKRGMGKTSFILSAQNKDFLDKYCVLEIIDPTLIETREHVFLNIISFITEKVKNKFADFSYEATDSFDMKYRNWQESLVKLAGGLNVIDGVGKNKLDDEDFWDSPELVLEKGINHSKHGRDLEKNFHSFIDKSLSVLGKKAFFLVLDDIDTSLEKGQVILEILRKYLTSKKLLIVMLGDIDLYSIIATQIQWSKLDSSGILLKYEFDKDRSKYDNEVEELESQYLTKILKPENRIDLRKLSEINPENILVSGKSTFFKKSDSVEKKNLITVSNSDDKNGFLNEILKNIFWLRKRYVKEYTDTILDLPIRSVVQILSTYDFSREKEYFHKHLKHIFYTSVNKKLRNYEMFSNDDSDSLFNSLGRYVINEGFSRDNHLKLIPDFPDMDNNVTMLYTNALFNSKVKYKSYLEYFIKVGYALQNFSVIARNKNFSENEKSLEKKKFIDHIALDSSESASNIAKRILSTDVAIGTNLKITTRLLGAVFIPKEYEDQIQSSQYGRILMSQVHLPRNSYNYRFISIFNLLGFISGILNCEDDNDIRSLVNDSNNIRSFNFYDGNKDDSTQEGEQSTDFDKSPREDETDSEEFIKELSEWKNNFNHEQIKLPLFVLAKIWIRFVYTSNSIETKDLKTVADLFKVYIAGFLNAVLVETELYEERSIDVRNP
ncbi:MAG: hypothetical protein ACQESC_04855, partial [Nanobdellota archaeon]